LSRATRRKPFLPPSPPLSPLPPPRQPPQGLWRWALPLILALYLGLAAWHAAVVPIGQTGYQNAPDEAAHVAYARSLAAGHLPTRASAARTPNGYEWHQPPLYYALAARFLPLGERAARCASILCGLAGLLLIYRAARLLFPDDPVLAVLAAGVAALTPTHIAITSTVNNDALLEVCFSAALLILISAFLGGFTTWRACWLGLAIGAALLTKATGLLLLPVTLLAFVLLGRGGESPKNILRGATWAGIIALSASGWWFVRNARLYGEFLPLRAFEASFAGTVQAKEIAAQLGGWPAYLLFMAVGIFKSFWAVYGTPQTALHGAWRFLPDQVYWLFGGVCIAALLGLTQLHFRRKSAFNDTQTYILWLLFATIGLVAVSFLGFILKYFQMQGRYLYPAMLSLCVLLALGWRALFPERYTSLASGLLLVLLGAISLAFLRTLTP
jgi:4-amino-4-deoxy-L-arabinose transferase-like glycosyltransferase